MDWWYSRWIRFYFLYYISMLDKEEIMHLAQEWFDCDEKHAELFANEVIKSQKTKEVLIEWIPQMFMFTVLMIYLIFHR